MTNGGSFMCDICGLDFVHSHTAWDVERERYCRPQFEAAFEQRYLIPLHPGFAQGGTFGRSLFWKQRQGSSYVMPQVELAWDIWQCAWLERGDIFPEMQAACRYAAGTVKEDATATKTLPF